MTEDTFEIDGKTYVLCEDCEISFFDEQYTIFEEMVRKNVKLIYSNPLAASLLRTSNDKEIMRAWVKGKTPVE